MERYGTLAARILISQIFILSGAMKVMDPAATAAQMEGRGMFWIPFFLWSAAAVELVGGLSLLVGYKARLGALSLFLFLIPVTPHVSQLLDLLGSKRAATEYDPVHA